MDLAIIISVITLVIVGAGFAMLYRMMAKQVAVLQQPTEDKPDQALQLINQNIQGMQERLDKVGEGMNVRLDNAAKVVADVSRELGQVQEMGRSMQQLQNFLRSPKLRGNIGEQVLNDLLGQSFPQESFKTQYKFSDGHVVDAVLKTDNGLICIDSKFPLENFDKLITATSEEAEVGARKLFVRDVKKHIKDIAKKYILPDEGTATFAVMYVPSEAVFYEIIRNDEELNTLARELNIILVSPNSFFYFLKVILVGMQGKKIEDQAHKILTTMEALVKDSQKVGDALGVLNTHLSNAKGAVDKVNTQYGLLSSKIDQIKLLK